MTATGEVADWRALAACTSADEELFFPISAAGPALQQVEEAKAICAACQVQQPCLDFALATGQIHGVWGGTTEEERVRLRRQHAAQHPQARPPAPQPRRRQRSRQRQRPPAR